MSSFYPIAKQVLPFTKLAVAVAAPGVAAAQSPAGISKFQSIQLSNQFSCEGAAAADINGDGRVDVLNVPMPGTEAHWFENLGDPEEHWTRHVMFDAVDNESLTLVDVSGDGEPDLLCQSQGHFGFVEIPADPTTGSWPFPAISPDLGYPQFTHGLGAGDVDCDGRIDVV